MALNGVPCSASLDNIRLWNVTDAPESDATRRTTPAFKIIAGHHGGIVSEICRWLDWVWT